MVKKKHPWRLCGPGSYYVKEHFKTLISGEKRSWSAHCRKYKNNKDILSRDELGEMYNLNKGQSYLMPTKYNFGSHLGNKYDQEIGFWSHFWKEQLNKKTNITPTLIKKLIMSESSFNPRSRAKTHDGSGSALGLMQITEYTFSLLKEDKGELRNNFFKVTKEDLDDPVVNIAVGVRWLYRKRDIAKYYLKKEPNELELAEEYKGIRNDNSPKANRQRKAFKKIQKKYLDNSK